jgi:hypothetical protein
MGRAGIEPATLGLKVQLNRLQQVATGGNFLQITQIETAANYPNSRVTETNLYVVLYVH